MPRAALSILAAVLLFAVPASAQVGGVYVDAKGMLRQTSSLAPNARLELLRKLAVDKPASEKLAAGSSLRKVSLKRLEAAVEAAHRSGKELPAEVRFLAGLTRLRYVFFDPQQGDVILAGPAEGWTQLETGEVVGTKSGRPVLHLDDLIAALRYAFPERRKWEFIGCSIDPTAQGLKNYAAYVRKLRRIDRRRLRAIFAGMERAMGPQAVRLFGVERSSRFALTMLAADYRLKRLAMGHDRSPVKQVASYLDLAARRTLSSRQPQHRWWFLAEYDAIRHTPDRMAFELVGQGVKVAAARTFVSKKGNADKPPKIAPAAKQLCTNFTRYFPELAKHVPVFAELQNGISLAVAAELIAQRRSGEPQVSATPTDLRPTARRSWKPGHFLDGKRCPIAKYPVPKSVPSLASYRLDRGREWIISVSGGVEIDPRRIVEKTTKPASEKSGLNRARKASHLPAAAGRWWWD